MVIFRDSGTVRYGGRVYASCGAPVPAPLCRRIRGCCRLSPAHQKNDRIAQYPAERGQHYVGRMGFISGTACHLGVIWSDRLL